ncbi:slipin family protein [Streptomyces sp. 2231.1]|uniref:slipin family protein n=1 Tax=Streptomyces sp. 2231.1 TaxID=1855347 RepID=UPI00210E04A7|nr:slipin family protein [Streptomyces sp. 2231.1]
MRCRAALACRSPLRARGKDRRAPVQSRAARRHAPQHRHGTTPRDQHRPGRRPSARFVPTGFGAVAACASHDRSHRRDRPPGRPGPRPVREGRQAVREGSAVPLRPTRRNTLPGLRFIIPFVDARHRVSLLVVTMPIQSQGIITRDNVSVDVSAVAYFRVVEAVKSVVAVENVNAAINHIAQTTLRKVVGGHTLDETLSETDRINLDIRQILDVTTVDWGVQVTLVELKDIQVPDTMKRALARQAEAEREKRAKIINAEGESLAAAALGDASDTMTAHPLALQLRNLQSLVEIGVDQNTTVVFPAPLMSTIGELGSFLARETAAAAPTAAAPPAGDGRTDKPLSPAGSAPRYRSMTRLRPAPSAHRGGAGERSVPPGRTRGRRQSRAPSGYPG